MKVRIYWKDGGFFDQEISRFGSLDRCGIRDITNVARIDQIGEDGKLLNRFDPPRCPHPDEDINVKRDGSRYCTCCGKEFGVQKWTVWEHEPGDPCGVVVGSGLTKHQADRIVAITPPGFTRYTEPEETNGKG